MTAALNWFRKLATKLVSPESRCRSPWRRHALPLRLEVLENRTLPSGANILLLGSENGNATIFNNVKAALASTPALSGATIGSFDTTSATPTLSLLEGYTAVLNWTDATPTNPTGLGNVLANYVDAGGRVVMATYSFSSTWAVQGGIATHGYDPFQVLAPGSGFGGASTTTHSLTSYNSGSDIFTGVSGTPSYWTNSNYTNPTLDSGATLLGTDNFGNNVVAVNSSTNVVGISIYPGVFGTSTTDTRIYDIVANALVATYGVNLNNGVLTISQALAGNDNLNFSLSGGTYTFTDTGGLTFGTPTGNGAGFVSGGGTSTITIPSTDVTSIAVGLGTGTNVFNFTGSAAAIAPMTVNTGSTSSDQIQFTGALTESGTISLTTGGSISQTVSGTGLTATSLSATAAGGIGSLSNPLALNASSLTTNSSGNNGNEFLQDSGTVSITSLNAGSGTIDLTGGTFNLSGSNQLNSSSKLQVDAGTFGIGTNTQTVAQLILNGGTVSGTTGVLTSTAVIDARSGTASAVLAGGNGLSKTTGGTVTLGGANTYTGATSVTGGTFVVNGSITSNTTVTSPAILRGSGTITGNVSGTGTFEPGNSPGIMTINGNFTPTGTVTFEVNSPYVTAGTDYDQYIVSGSVNLSGATLTFTNTNDATAPAVNSVLTLISKTSAGATTPSSNPAQGSVVTIASRHFYVFYNGGDGNDVVLVEASTPSTVYTNPAWSGLNPGQVIADADPVTPGNQTAVFGVTAFATVGGGLGAVAAGGTVYVNTGSYSTEAVNVTSGDTLKLLGTGPGSPGTVTFGSLAGTAGTTVDTGTVGTLANTLQEGGLGTSTMFVGVLSGPGGLTIQGGTLTLGGGATDTNANTFTGPTNVNAGELLLNKSAGTAALGGNTINVNSGGTLQDAAANQINNTSAVLTVNPGGTFILAGNNETVGVLAGGGAVTNNSNTTATLTIDHTSNGPLVLFSGVLSDKTTGTTTGALSFTVTDYAHELLGGTSPNTYTGATNISGPDGALGLDKSAGTNAISGNTVNVNAYGVLQLYNNEQIVNTADLTITAGGIFYMVGFNETIDALNGNGTVSNSNTSGNNHTATLTVGANNAVANFSGQIDDTEYPSYPAALLLTKIGTGTQTLSGTNTYTGVTNVNGGTLTVTGVINNDAVASGGTVNLNTAGGTLNGIGTINGNVVVKASTFANPTTIQSLTVTHTVSGTASIALQSGAIDVQIGTSTGNGVSVLNNAGSTGVSVVSGSSAAIYDSFLNGNHIGIDVNGGIALIQGTQLNTTFTTDPNTSITGLQVENSAIVDAGQLAASATPLPDGPAGNVGYYGDITGLLDGGVELGSTAHSLGGNTFDGYSVSTSTTNPAAAQAIRDLNTGPSSTVTPRANGVETSFNYSSVGPLLGRMDLPAQNNTFAVANGSGGYTPVTSLFNIDQLIFHDLDNTAEGFVSYGTNMTGPATIIATPQYFASYATTPTPSNGFGTLSNGTQSLTSGQQKSMIRGIAVTFSSFVFLDPNLLSTTSNRGLNLLQVNSPYGPGSNTLVLAGLSSSTHYNQSNGNYTVVFNFSGSATEFASLQDGNYSLQFNAAAIQSGGPGGPALGASGFVDPTTWKALFFRYFGDTNGDAMVDNKDQVVMQKAVNTLSGQANYQSYLDFSNRGYITSADYQQFMKRYATRLDTDPSSPTYGQVIGINPAL